MSEGKSMAQTAYEAYARVRRQNGTNLVGWESLSSVMQEGWQVAADSVSTRVRHSLLSDLFSLVEKVEHGGN